MRSLTTHACSIFLCPFGKPQSILQIKPRMYADGLLSEATATIPIMSVNNNSATPNNLQHVFDFKHNEVDKMYGLQCKREKAALI